MDTEQNDLRVHSRSNSLWIGTKTNVGDRERLLSTMGGLGLLCAALARRDTKGLLAAVLGGYLVYRGVSGRCGAYAKLGLSSAEPRPEGILVDKSIEIDMPREELYRFWLDFENLPRFMDHVQAVWMIGDHRYHWVAKAPAGMTVEWDADVVLERTPDLIAWRSLEGADIPNEGSVRFEESVYGTGTIVHVSLRYYPPAGKIGAWVASLFGEEPSMQIEQDLAHFKELMESR